MEYFSIVVVSLMVLFALIAIIDTVFLKNKLKLGPEFKKAFDLVGPIVLAITGIIAFVPHIAWIMERTITPLYKMIGLDPSMAVTTILAMDMGGFQLAREVALDATIGDWAGMVYGSMMGATIVFSIPVGLASIKKEDVAYFSKGVLFGIAAIPFGTFVGGLMMGIDVVVILLNLIIPVIFSIIIILCLGFFPKATIKVFQWFSIFVDAFATIALGFVLVKDLVLLPLEGVGALKVADIPFFKIMGSSSEGIQVGGTIGLVLCGTLPFISVLTRVLKKPLAYISRKTGMTEIGTMSFLTTSANSMSTFPNLYKMDNREKILNTSYAVCAAWVIGDHLAFAAANAPELIAPMMVAKLVSGIIAVAIAYLFTRKMKSEKGEVENSIDNPVLEN